jgi:hypothetical protein
MRHPRKSPLHFFSERLRLHGSKHAHRNLHMRVVIEALRQLVSLVDRLLHPDASEESDQSENREKRKAAHLLPNVKDEPRARLARAVRQHGS